MAAACQSKSCSVVRSRPGISRSPKHALRCSAAATQAPVRQLLDQCQQLGSCRFIVIGDGAILESVADWRQAKYTDLPEPKGTLATISNEDKTFECHVFLNKVAQAKLARGKARTGDFDTFALRLLDASDKVLLTCLLHGPQGNYDPAAVQAWEAMHAQYGDLARMQ